MPEGQSCSEHYVHRGLGQGLNKRKPSIPDRMEMPGFVGLLENSPYQHSSQCHPALATKSIKKRLQPVEVAAVL